MITWAGLCCRGRGSVATEGESIPALLIKKKDRGKKKGKKKKGRQPTIRKMREKRRSAKGA